MDPPAPFHPGATRRVRQTVRVGVGVLVVVPPASSEDACFKIYAGTRKGNHGAGRLALPGGHLELYESWEDCARREVMEEMYLDLPPADEIRVGHVTNDIMRDEEKHYVTIIMMAQLPPGAPLPTNTEPDKCEGWEAYSWSELRQIAKKPNRLFGPLQQLVQDQPSAVLEFLEEQKE